MKTKKLALVLIVILCFSIFAACNFKTPAPNPDPTPNPVVPSFELDEFSRIDGSTVTLPLTLAVAEKVCGVSYDRAQAKVVHSRTHQAYERLVTKEVDIIFVTLPSMEEYGMAEVAGVEYVITPVVNDAFIFLINKQNPVDGLTVDQIRDIYSGKIANWSQVGGDDAVIFAYQRQENSGSQTGMLNLVMAETPMMDAPTEMRPTEMGGLIERVAGYDNAKDAIGYSYYYYANSMYIRDAVKFLEVDGVAVSDQTIESGEYPLVTPYYAVTRKGDDGQNGVAKRLLEFILSDQGQQIAQESGYVKVS